MTLTYFGQMKDARQNTRVAQIGFNEDDKKDCKLAERLIDLMEKVTAWKLAGAFEDCYLVAVDDKDDFNDFKDWYKESKRTLQNCMKFGF